MCSNEKNQQTPRQVLLCFLEVARIFGRREDYKGALPDLVKFEQVKIFNFFLVKIFKNFCKIEFFGPKNSGIYLFVILLSEAKPNARSEASRQKKQKNFFF